ncbi:hypothetical protein [Candidatus Odyssella acanthamoebae]|uniref:Lysozyme inhibitor LprI N-terminal domain-containing protein n=1 Tax=Candidatus Odyssella acanthamoebae TaxID=91604 RepID=A0A077AYQ8_9PROT|nr:hypothetical protein [Candidatus Paracaedibacter acanthamoebae]AIK97139.1 hypothetical protein ID47_10975 [Candidatus Paracaedibacter acanthamoebae]
MSITMKYLTLSFFLINVVTLSADAAVPTATSPAGTAPHKKLDLRSSGFGGSSNAPQDEKGVLRDCLSRIKMIEGKESLFKAPPKPKSPFKWSKWKKDAAVLEKAKQEYSANIAELRRMYTEQAAKLKKMGPTDKHYNSTMQELYSNCKRFADGIAIRASQATGIKNPPAGGKK